MKLNTRELYCPSHFGNSYESTLPDEMTGRLSEARFWGFNRYSDWFDTIDLYNLYARSDGKYNLPEAMWERKLSNYRCAADLGFDLGLVVTPNHVFADQVTPENGAVKSDRFFGQLVCPSKAGVTELVLGNYRLLFRDFAAHGLELASVSGGAYDYGGCACDRCRPWIVTFGKLFAQVIEVAREFFPKVKAELWGWWWTAEDHTLFTEWASTQAPGFYEAFAFHIPYEHTAYRIAPIPVGCVERAFLHIGYGNLSGNDRYCHYGANIAPRRLEATIAWLARRGADGFLAYSEGDHDDVNKAIAGALASGACDTADEVLMRYAQRYFGNDPEGWARLLPELSDFDSIDPERCRRDFDRLSGGARDSWRLRQIGERLAMAEADRAVRAESTWTPSRLAAAREFVLAKERLYRDVWHLGIQRHIFGFHFMMPPWYEEYRRHAGRAGDTAAARSSADA
jgi:hypothetical protein